MGMFDYLIVPPEMSLYIEEEHRDINVWQTKSFWRTMANILIDNHQLFYGYKERLFLLPYYEFDFEFHTYVIEDKVTHSQNKQRYGRSIRYRGYIDTLHMLNRVECIEDVTSFRGFI